MSDKNSETVVPLSTRMSEPKDATGYGVKYGVRGVKVFQEPYADGFLDSLSLTTLARIKDQYLPYMWKENGRVAVDDNGDLLVGIVVQNGSGRSQVMLRIESEELFAHLAEMRAKTKKAET